MAKECDNTSVGVIITNERQQMALIKRGRFPIGIAPPAGHIDEHGSAEQAAIEEVSEEVGVALDGLRRTVIDKRRVDNVCRRVGGDHHIWTVYEAHVAETNLAPDPDETQGAAWYDPDDVQRLVERTRAYGQGSVSEEDWAARPGLEPVWLDFMVELGYVS